MIRHIARIQVTGNFSIGLFYKSEWIPIITQKIVREKEQSKLKQNFP